MKLPLNSKRAWHFLKLKMEKLNCGPTLSWHSKCCHVSWPLHVILSCFLALHNFSMLNLICTAQLVCNWWFAQKQIYQCVNIHLETVLIQLIHKLLKNSKTVWKPLKKTTTKNYTEQWQYHIKSVILGDSLEYLILTAHLHHSAVRYFWHNECWTYN